MYLVFRSTNCSIIDTFPTVQALTCAQVQGLLRPASAAFWMKHKASPHVQTGQALPLRSAAPPHEKVGQNYSPLLGV